jgi:hypothetical protein
LADLGHVGDERSLRKAQEQSVSDG